MVKRNIIIFITNCWIFISLVGCVSVYRIPLKVTPTTIKSNIKHNSVLLQFEQTTKGIPLNETVWSNIKSAYRDSIESQKIGFTQNRNIGVIPIIPIATITTYKVDSEILIPFGNIFSKKLISAFDSTNSSITSTYTDEDTKEVITVKRPETILKTKIDSFFVWEAPLNHLNFYTVGSFVLLDSTSKEIKKHNFKRVSLRNNLGGIFSTSSHFLDEMLTYSNIFAEEVVSEILTKLEQQ